MVHGLLHELHILHRMGFGQLDDQLRGIQAGMFDIFQGEPFAEMFVHQTVGIDVDEQAAGQTELAKRLITARRHIRSSSARRPTRVAASNSWVGE